MSTGRETYEPGGLLVPWLFGLMVLGLVFSVIAFISTSQQIAFLNRVQASQKKLLEKPFDRDVMREWEDREMQLTREAEENDKRQMLVGLVQFGLFIATAVLFLRSLSRANRNARAMGARNMDFTPGWCMGWFFVPVANLFKPYQAVAETWRASVVSDNWRNNAVSPIVGLWWACWLAHNFLGTWEYMQTNGATSIEDLKSASVVSMVVNVADFPLTIVAILMIRNLYVLQEEKHRVVGEVGDIQRQDHACQSCGEPVNVMIGNCPMCGEPLVASPSSEWNG